MSPQIFSIKLSRICDVVAAAAGMNHCDRAEERFTLQGIVETTARKGIVVGQFSLNRNIHELKKKKKECIYLCMLHGAEEKF